MLIDYDIVSSHLLIEPVLICLAKNYSYRLVCRFQHAFEVGASLFDKPLKVDFGFRAITIC